MTLSLKLNIGFTKFFLLSSQQYVTYITNNFKRIEKN